MKNITKAAGLFLIIATSFILSCTTDDNSTNNPDARANYLGTWGVTETQVKTYYVVTITADPNAANRVLIANFAGLGNSVVATAFISGSSITLDPGQSVAGFTLNGGGSLSGSSAMNWTYSLNDGADITQYTAIFSKK